MASGNAVAAEVTTAKVELARCEQRLESLRLRLTQFEDDSRERERAIAQVRAAAARRPSERHEASQLAMLAASAAIAELALQAESLGAADAASALRGAMRRSPTRAALPTS